MRFGLREIIFFAVLLAVPLASWMYVFQPRNEDIERAQNEIARKQRRLSQLHEMTAQIDDIGAELEKGRDSIRLIEAKLPSQEDVEGILEQIWQVAKRNQLSLRSVKSGEPVPAAMYMEQPLEVIMEGNFNGFYQFLLEMEELPRITRIHDMELIRIGEKDTPDEQHQVMPGAMRADFTLSIYFKPQQMAGL